MITVQRMRRLEVWDAPECDGGTRVAIVDAATSVIASAQLAGDGKLAVTVPLNAAVIDELTELRVLRVVGTDAAGAATFDEYRLIRLDPATGTGLVPIVAAPLTVDLAGRTLVGETDGAGVTRYDVELVGLTPTQILTTFVLPALAAAGQGWVSLGTVDPTQPIDSLVLEWDTPLAVCLKIAEATQTEFDLRRIGTTGYALDFRDALNATAPIADLRAGRNLTDTQQARDSAPQATRVYPRGAALGGAGDAERATMARALWSVVSVVGAVVQLADPAGGEGPIAFDGQLVGAALRRADGTLTEVTDADADLQTVTVADATGIAGGDRVGFAVDVATGGDLTSLEHPVDAAPPPTGYGVKVGVLDAPDVPGALNLLANPVMRSWPGATNAPPPGWATVADANGVVPTIAKQTAAPYTRIGGASIKVTATGDGQGVTSDAAAMTGPTAPTAFARYVSGYGRVWVVSGQVRVELVLTTGTGGVAVRPLAGSAATSSVLGQFEDIGITGEEAFALGSAAEPAVSIALRVVQHGATPAVFYLDAGQATPTATQEPLVEGAGANVLWQRANAQLRTGSIPAVAYTVALVDLVRLDEDRTSLDVLLEPALQLGGTVRLTEPRLGARGTTRLIGIDRDYLAPGRSMVTLSSRPEDLTGTLARPTKGRRFDPDVGGESTLRGPGISIRVSDEGVVSAVLEGDLRAARHRAVALRGNAEADEATVEAAPLVYGRIALASALLTVAPGELFCVSARSYRSDGMASDILAKRDQRVGPAIAAPTFAAPIAMADRIVYPFTYDTFTTRIEWFSSEFLADPGEAVSQENIGDIPTGTPLTKGDGATSLTLPLARSSNYRLTTAVCYDQINRRGLVITFKTQGDATNGGGTAPDAPTALVVVGTTASTVTLRATMPAANLPASLRVYRDGLAYGADVARTAGAGATQDIVVSGLAPATSYSFAVAGVSAGGIESATRSPSVNATTTTATLGAFTIRGTRSGAFFTVSWTPPASHPLGTLYTAQVNVAGGGFGDYDQTTDTNVVIEEAQPFLVRVVASAAGAGATVTSNTLSVHAAPVGTPL